MNISAIVAIGKNRVIGKNNSMMWSIPSEQKHYLDIVGDNHYLLGRKNFEANKTFHEKRKSLILSRNQKISLPRPSFSSYEAALEYSKNQNEKELFILGGAQIYELSLPHINRLYLSIVDYEQEGDAYFPDHTQFDWKVVEKKTFHKNSHDTPIAWEFLHLEKR
jgi:dihydrofolate reductase